MCRSAAVSLNLLAVPQLLLSRYGERDLAWTAAANWTFQRSFDVSTAVLDQTQVDLVLEGVDTVANVLVNGKVAGRTVSAFRCVW